MSAWIAGIQFRRDASGDIRVNLDSSAPCWNDAIEGALLEATEVLLPTHFRRSTRSLETKISEPFIDFVLLSLKVFTARANFLTVVYDSNKYSYHKPFPRFEAPLLHRPPRGAGEERGGGSESFVVRPGLSVCFILVAA